MRSAPIFRLLPLTVGLAAAAVIAGCSSDSDADTASGSDNPSVVVTTGLLGDVVENIVAGSADVNVVLPAGADPHDFQPSAQQVALMRGADVLVTNGGGFEEGLASSIEGAEEDGVTVCAALDGVTASNLLDEDGADADGAGDDHDSGDDHDADHDDDHDSGDDHDDEHDDAGEHDDHDHGGATPDPHFFTSPAAMADAVDWLADCIAEAAPAAEEAGAAEAYAAELALLDAEAEEMLATVAEENRKLVTNHDVFGYLAQRYGFEQLGSVYGRSTHGQADASTISGLADQLRSTGVPAVFTDSSSADDLARTLADEAGGVDVVVLHSESLGGDGSGAETYLEMVRSNVTAIAEALG